MRANHRKDLENIARQMILVHNADALIELVLRTIVSNLRVTHAGILIYDKTREEYVVKISKGRHGFKIPSGFVKVTKKNPLIEYFTNKKRNFPKDFILFTKIDEYIRNSKKSRATRAFLQDLKVNLSFHQARVCVPGFFGKDLIGILFLGDKVSKKRFSEGELGFLSVLASDVVMALKNAWLVEDISTQLANNKRLFLQMVATLASSIEAKDKYTMGHTERVMEYSLDIANKMKNEKNIVDWGKFLENLKISALLHDIGKIGIPESILNKPDSLTDEERKVIRQHPLIGVNILKNVDELDEALLGVKFHHERYDGKGYPSGLSGEDIPFIASVISLADAFDAMTTDRPYRKALSLREAVAEIKRNKGKQFAPDVVDAFLKAYISRDIEK
ncbi:MAG: HD domain-containing protein [Candidatus Omnitrophica bacterium]|nr:HD domain-containing protein [Candidatus Omnitrophota bacterium]